MMEAFDYLVYGLAFVTLGYIIFTATHPYRR